MAETLAPLRYCEDLFNYRRRQTRVVMVGKVGVGGGNPIRVQSMTTTDTMDVAATVEQSLRMAAAGCEIVRVTAPTVEDARRLGKIKEGLLKRGVDVPLVADIHFSPAAAMEAAEHVEKVRINPGNYVDNKRFAVKEYTEAEYAAEIARIEERFTPLVLKLKSLKRALRVGTNHGSLSDRIMNRYGDSPLGMVESALEFVRICEKNGFYDVILSMKASNPKVMIAAYRLLAARMAEQGQDYPFHLGVTEAGDGEDGRIKSAIGIGGLLEDGIGDTIRVSLTEEPELEVPVCYALAEAFHKRGPAAGRKADAPAHCRDFYSYARRKTRAFHLGPFLTGALQLTRVVTPVPGAMKADQLLAFLEEQLKKAKGADPEVISWTIRGAGDVENLKAIRRSLAGETSRLAFLGRFETPLETVLDGLAAVDLVCWAKPREERYNRFLAAVKTRGIPQLIEAEGARQALGWERLSQESGVSALVGLSGEDCSALLKEYRALAAAPADFPIHVRAPREPDEERQILKSSVLIGSLLCDGIGDSVQIDSEQEPRRNLELTYNILQGAGVRVTKTEFVSCPSCGRTLFNLQTTTERIKSKTGHLKGVKIAIMGCIVNGPGEMADADFGYVGGAPDRINLYVGKECVQKGIPSETADQALIDLIKAHGKWVDPVA